MEQSQQSPGRIITFYSYKGGTGRSMTVANVAWLLASRGYRVLAIDWDLEAPGLHRYFEPFLTDKSLESSTGVIDFALEFASAAVAQTSEEAKPGWHLDYANIREHAIPVNWEFADGGLLHLVPAGRQDAGYAVRVNGFDWRQLYEKLGGGVWLESAKQLMRESYDYILIDSRTGVSDTSGICTVQMPDDLVVCFTVNNQSTKGAAAIAQSALQQRRGVDGKATLKIWPLPMRVDPAEQERLQIARALMRTRFSGLTEHMTPEAEDIYWGEMEVAYFPLYAYEEVLAAFADRPRESRSLLASMEMLVKYLVPDAPPAMPMAEDVRLAGWRKYTAKPAAELMDDLKLMAEEYVQIRNKMGTSRQRTYLMTALLERAALVARGEGVAQVAEALFRLGSDGARVIGLGLAKRDPRRSQIDMAIEGIAAPRSPFEQYHALVLADLLQSQLDPTSAMKLRDAVSGQKNKGYISTADKSRLELADGLLAKLNALLKTQTFIQFATEATRWAFGAASRQAQTAQASTSDSPVPQCVDIPVASGYLRYDDPVESHGPWLVSREKHSLSLPPQYKLGATLVTNTQFLRFTEAGGYERQDLWSATGWKRIKYFCAADRKSPGPATWPNFLPPGGEERYPVTGICFYEAMAFAAWLQQDAPTEGWQWTLPQEDEWEYAARTEAGLVYPWGDSFDETKCNSAESNLGKTTPVDRYAAGASRNGCLDMAGNAWEFVLSADANEDQCFLRGGARSNNKFEVRSYLRLFGVRKTLRAKDFGLRVAQVLAYGDPESADD